MKLRLFGLPTTAAFLALLAPRLAAYDVVETGTVVLDQGADPILAGLAVAIGSGVTLIGGNIGAGPGFEAGSVRVIDTATRQELRILLPDDGAPGLLFGYSISVSGDTALVAAQVPAITLPSDPLTGAAYLFDLSTGLQTGTLNPVGGAPDDRFGSDIAIDGTTAAVGASGDNQDQGAVYLFDASTGQQIFKLTASDGAAGDFFGQRIAVSGSTLLVSAIGDDDNGLESGSAYLFDTATGQELAKLVAQAGKIGDLFGASVAIGEQYALIGAPLDDDNAPDSGAAYVFDVATGQELFKLLPSVGDPAGLFGNSVAMDGDLGIIGAQYAKVDGLAAGAASLFDLSSGLEVASLTASDGALGDGFGAATAISGSVAVCAAPFRDGTSTEGSAYFFDISAVGTLASVVSRNGSGVNASILSSQIGPVLGFDWSPNLDASGHAAGLAVVVVFEEGSSGMFVSGGEILVDPSSTFGASMAQSHSGGAVTLAIDVPDDTSLCGVQASAQGVVFGAPGYELSNALDLVIGR